MPTATASAKLLDPVLQIAQHNHQDLHALLAAAQLENIEKDKPGARIPTSAFCRLLEELGHRSENDRIALRIGEATQPRMLGSIGFLMTTAVDLRASYQVLIDYLPLLFEGIHLQMEQSAAGTELTLELEHSEERKTAEWFMACLLSWPRWISGKQIPALKIELIYPPPADTQAYERFFASEVTYNGDHNRLLIPSSYLKFPCLDANEEMHRLHLEFADNLLSVSGREGALVAQIKSLIRHGLTDGQGGIRREKIAASLNLSLRTLQRKLGKLNTSFQELYDQTRKEQALQQIQKGSVSFGELSFLLGFSNQSAFQKAFKRWVGMPPSQYREQIKPKSILADEQNHPRTLAGLIPGGGLTLKAFFSPALQLTAALEKLHQQGSLAHDLCPNHIAVELAGSEPQLSLIDPNPLVPIKPLERLRYLAPEKSGLIPVEVDFRADFYTLGCIFYEMLCGKPPYTANEAGALLHAHMTAPLPPLDAAPKQLRRLVYRLLSKSADDRYQSSHGLYTSLLSCQQNIEKLETLRLSEPEDSAELAAPMSREAAINAIDNDDTPDQLIFPQKLYGREEAIMQLREALNQSRQGVNQLTLISGASGVGKSSLVNQLRLQLIKLEGNFIRGQFDPLQRQRPYSAFIQAIQQLLHQKLAGPKSDLKRWKRKLSQQLSQDLWLLSSLVTDLELILNARQKPGTKQKPSPPPAELEQRIANAFQKILISNDDHPIVLFLDNLQWIDGGSLNLLKSLLNRQDKHPLLLMAAYRDDELEATHPLALELPLLKQAKQCTLLKLPPLTVEHTRQLLADVFHQDGSEPVALAGWLHRKTQGNPFFIRQYLQQLHKNRWIYFDREKQCWSWQQHAFENQTLSADVQELVAFQIAKLPAITQQILTWGAAIGNSFDLSTVSKASGQPLARVVIHLWPALQGGLIISQPEQPGSPPNCYRFLHDHIRQSAYQRINNEEKQKIHLSIGQILLRQYSRTERGAGIYDLVNHLNLARDLLESDQRRIELIQLNFKAALKAKEASAFKPACGFLGQAALLLQPQDWQNEYQLCVELHLLQAQSEYLCGEYLNAEKLYKQLPQHLTNTTDKARLALLQADQYLLQDRHSQAMEVISANLKSPIHSVGQDQRYLRQQLHRINKLFESSSIMKVIENLAEMSSDDRVQMELLQLLSQVAERNGESSLSASALAEMTLLSLTGGRSPQLPLALAGYAYLASWLYGDSHLSQRVAHQSLRLLEPGENRTIAAKSRFINGAKVVHWTSHLKDSLSLLESSQELGLESGDWPTAGQAILVATNNQWMLGHSLKNLQKRCHNLMQLLQQINNPHLIASFKYSAIYLTSQLTGHNFDSTAAETCLDLQQHKAPAPFNSSWQTLSELVVSYLLEQTDKWPGLVAKENLIEQQLGGHFATTEALFFIALIRLEICRKANRKTQQHILRKIQHTRTRMELWSRHCPQNFAHRQALLGALEAELQQHPESAMSLFEEAIGGAENQGFLQHQAIANEQYGRFWYNRGQTRVGRYFIDESQQLYQRWGAFEKAKKLAELMETSS
ncbi:AAA family ATPase [Motiliproteus sp. MSK22-1]|uniref:AAA family ATPase n=1 Tax=Motiliproteus sp. MSK22-1 TaxID=1897630 RepID=UPI00097571FA|nr:AAA family ATPase [Motiliproteus sp. MSK22-1]OMH25606.1 hypothetical protein BGP75_23955 [Motiliproteus sp. MSK22-1]